MVLAGLGAILKWMNWTKQIRQDNNVHYPTHRPQKPDYLVLVNSFFGLEVRVTCLLPVHWLGRSLALYVPD